MGRVECKYSLLITMCYDSVTCMAGERKKKAYENEFAEIDIAVQALNITFVSFQLIQICEINLKAQRRFELKFVSSPTTNAAILLNVYPLNLRTLQSLFF